MYVKSLTCTCGASPSQWEGTVSTLTGVFDMHIRYRSHSFFVTVSCGFEIKLKVCKDFMLDPDYISPSTLREWLNPWFEFDV